MRIPPLCLLLILAACGGQSQIPVSSAPRPDTRLGRHDAFEALLLSTNVRTLPTRDRLAGTPRSLWPVLVRTYTELGLSIAHLDSSALVLGNPGIAVRQQLAGERLSIWIDCGRTATGVPLTDRYNVMVQIFTQLLPSPSGTEVRTVLTGRALNPTTNDPPVDCVSTGRLEKRIVGGLAVVAGD